MRLINKLSSIQDEADAKHALLKRVGQWGFLFFAAKGVLWLIFSFSVVWFGVK